MARYTVEYCWNQFSDKPNLSPLWNAVPVGQCRSDSLEESKRCAIARAKRNRLNPAQIVIGTTNDNGRYTVACTLSRGEF
jgi:hypothetical protein